MISRDDVLICDDTHQSLIDREPWGDFEGGKFVGQIVFDCFLSEEGNCPIYEFTVDSLIDEFLDANLCTDGLLEDASRTYEGIEYTVDSLTRAKGMVNNIRSIIERLETVIAKSEAAALKVGDE